MPYATADLTDILSIVDGMMWDCNGTQDAFDNPLITIGDLLPIVSSHYDSLERALAIELEERRGWSKRKIRTAQMRGGSRFAVEVHWSLSCTLILSLMVTLTLNHLTYFRCTLVHPLCQLA